MKSRRAFLAESTVNIAATSVVAMLPSLAYAAPAKKSWIELFDGKSLKGWHKNPKRIGHGTGGIWRAEGGAITGEQDPPGSGNGGILLTDQKFGDFELLIDIMPDWGCCSGLFVRSNDKGQCIQMMVDYHDAGNVGHLYGEGSGGFNTRTFDINGKYDKNKKLVGMTSAKRKTGKAVGLDYTCKPAAWIKAWKINDWNTTRVRVQGKHPRITTWINGLKVCDWNGALAKTPGYNKDNVHRLLGAKGSVAVQVHGGKGWPKGAKCRWKNIKIKSL